MAACAERVPDHRTEPEVAPPAVGERSQPARVRVALVPSRVPTNPYSELLARSVEAAGAELAEVGRPGWGWLYRNRGRVEAIHLHWLHVFYRHDGRPLRSVIAALGFAAMLVAARLLGYRLVWTMHNARPHDSPTPAADAIARLVAANLAEVVIHCEAARPLLARQKRFGGVHAIPHGSYAGFYADSLSREEARRRLGIDGRRTVFVAFGLIRAYKGLDRLVDAFVELSREVAADERPVLLVVGKPREAADERLVEAIRARCGDADVRWKLGFVPDDDVQLYMRAADFAALTFERVLVSGSAILALSFGVPLVAPRMGCLPELTAGGAGLLYEPDAGPLEALRAALAADPATLAEAARRRADELDWRAIGAAHVDLYGGKLR
jgi:glycosyltransferase involved in cell wall biosynthesis